MLAPRAVRPKSPFFPSVRIHMPSGTEMNRPFSSVTNERWYPAHPKTGRRRAYSTRRFSLKSRKESDPTRSSFPVSFFEASIRFCPSHAPVARRFI